MLIKGLCSVDFVAVAASCPRSAQSQFILPYFLFWPLISFFFCELHVLGSAVECSLLRAYLSAVILINAACACAASVGPDFFPVFFWSHFFCLFGP